MDEAKVWTIDERPVHRTRCDITGWVFRGATHWEPEACAMDDCSAWWVNPDHNAGEVWGPDVEACENVQTLPEAVAIYNKWKESK